MRQNHFCVVEVSLLQFSDEICPGNGKPQVPPHLLCPCGKVKVFSFLLIFPWFLKKRHTEHCASTTVTAHLSCALGICCFFKLVSNRDHKSEVRTKLWLLCILSCTLQVNVKTKPASLGHILVSRHQTNKLLQCNRRWERSCGLQRSTQRSLVYFQESVSHWRGSVTALLLYQCCAPEWDT